MAKLCNRSPHVTNLTVITMDGRILNFVSAMYFVKRGEVLKWAERFGFEYDEAKDQITILPKTNVRELAAELSEWGMFEI